MTHDCLLFLKKKTMKRFLLLPITLIAFCANAASITGFVFVDKNNNGVRDKNEEGIKEVTVSDLLSAVKTNGDGSYQLTTSPASNFIMISLPIGYSAKTWWSK